MNEKEITVLVDEEPVQVKTRPLSVFVHNEPMNIEVPSHAKVDPEKTIEFAKSIPQEDWESLRMAPGFTQLWKALWQHHEPPLNLQKSSLAIRHSVGMIVLLVIAKADGIPVHLQYPETYLHPAQAARIVEMLYTLNPSLKDTK